LKQHHAVSTRIKIMLIVCVYAGIGGVYNSPSNQTSLPNGDLSGDRKNGRKQKGLLRTFGEVFK